MHASDNINIIKFANCKINFFSWKQILIFDHILLQKQSFNED